MCMWMCAKIGGIRELGVSSRPCVLGLGEGVLAESWPLSWR